MKKNALWLILVLLFVACGDNVQKEYWENGNLKSALRYENGKLNGECSWYAPNGKMNLRANYKDEVLDGRCQRWHDNGNLAEDGWFKDGQRDSIYHTYSEKGILASEEFFVNGRPEGEIKNGMTTGKSSKKDSMLTV